MIIAVDFDGTLSLGRFPHCGPPSEPLMSALIEARRRRHAVILWTVRTGPALDQAIAWCEGQGLTFDKVNEDVRPPLQGRESRKVSADVYIDDKGCTPEEFLARPAPPKVIGWSQRGRLW
jgi:hypothetical protein